MSDFCADLDALFTEAPFIDRFRLARENGFAMAEFTVPISVDLGKLGDACAYDGLKIAVVSIHPDHEKAALSRKTRAAFAAWFDTMLDTADFVGAPFIHMPPFATTEDTWNDMRDSFVMSLKNIARRTREEGKKILLSFQNPLETENIFPACTQDVLSVLEELDDDRVFGILYDVYHAQMTEGGLSNSLETLLPLIGHIRISGVPMHQEPDDGEINYPYLLSLLNAHGYTHAISGSYTPRLTTTAGLRWLKTFQS